MAELTLIDSPTFGRFTFDAVFHLDHNATLTVTEHPVETGASVTDHAFLDAPELPMEIGMTDAATSVGSIAGSAPDRSVTAFARLYELMELREPVTVVTRLKTYDNMLVTSIAAPDDYTTRYALKATIIFRQIQLVEVSTLTVQQTNSSSKKKKSSNKKKKKKGGKTKSPSKPSSSSATSTPVNESILHQLFG